MRRIIGSIPALQRAILRSAAYIRRNSGDEDALGVLREISKEIGNDDMEVGYNEIKIKVSDCNQVAADRIRAAAKEEGKVDVRVKSGWATIAALYDR